MATFKGIKGHNGKVILHQPPPVDEHQDTELLDEPPPAEPLRNHLEKQLQLSAGGHQLPSDFGRSQPEPERAPEPQPSE